MWKTPKLWFILKCLLEPTPCVHVGHSMYFILQNISTFSKNQISIIHCIVLNCALYRMTHKPGLLCWLFSMMFTIMVSSKLHDFVFTYSGLAYQYKYCPVVSLNFRSVLQDSLTMSACTSNMFANVNIYVLDCWHGKAQSTNKTPLSG